MNDRDELFTVTHNPSADEPPQKSYIPKHEKPAEEKSAPQEDKIKEVRVPVYDAFMYEPIGFDDADKRNAEKMREAQLAAEHKSRIRRERSIVFLFVFLLLVTVGLAVYGIISDILNADKALRRTGADRAVVLYREQKPEGANDLSNFKDEDGRYTIEGAAAAVKPSIVEIYAYDSAARKTPTGTGSGIVISEDGFIITNAHVLEPDGFHDVHTMDGEVYTAKVIGSDKKTDIAVIKVNRGEFTPAVLGDSDETIVGEQVIAIGNPAGLSSTVTDGIVSAVNRKIKSDATGFEMDCIQTNADISPGNSGGALVNMYGQVIGITSSKYVSSSYEGLGFAITINEASPIIEELIKNGYVSGRFRIGIRVIDTATEAKRADINERIGFEIPEDFEGIYVDSISDDADIAKSALKAGDFITKINDIAVKTYDEMYDTISASYGPGDTVPATVAHIDKDGNISYYNIKFKLMEDTSGNY